MSDGTTVNILEADIFFKSVFTVLQLKTTALSYRYYPTFIIILLKLTSSVAYNISGSKEALLRYFSKEQDCSEDDFFMDDHREALHFYTDEKALSIFKLVTGVSSTSEVISIEKTKRNEYIRRLRGKGLTVKQVARLMDISETTVKRICKMDH